MKGVMLFSSAVRMMPQQQFSDDGRCCEVLRSLFLFKDRIMVTR